MVCNLSGMILRVLCSSLLALAAFGQVSTSRLTGIVQDTTGVDSSGGERDAPQRRYGRRAYDGNERGRHVTFDAIPTGFYAVEVEAKGFKRPRCVTTKSTSGPRLH